MDSREGRLIFGFLLFGLAPILATAGRSGSGNDYLCRRVGDRNHCSIRLINIQGESGGTIRRYFPPDPFEEFSEHPFRISPLHFGTPLILSGVMPHICKQATANNYRSQNKPIQDKRQKCFRLHIAQQKADGEKS